MEKLGYGPDKRLAVKVSTRNIPPYRDPAVILIDQLKEIYHRRRARDRRDTPTGSPRSCARTTRSASIVTGGGVDDPDQQFYENYACGSPRNYTGYCNPELDKLIDRAIDGSRPGKRKKLVWEIERKLAEDGARPIIFYNRFAYLLAAL